MRKMNNRIYLGMLSGVTGLIALTLVDIISPKMRILQRSSPSSARVWVSSLRKTQKWSGQFLGILMRVGLSMVGGASVVAILTKYGRDKLLPKGLFIGFSLGSIITPILSGFANHKPKTRNALSNLSAHAAFGLAAVFTAAKIGDDSLFDTLSQNYNSNPTEKVTVPIKGPKNNNLQPVYSDVNPNLEETTLM